MMLTKRANTRANGAFLLLKLTKEIVHNDSHVRLTLNTASRLSQDATAGRGKPRNYNPRPLGEGGYRVAYGNFHFGRDCSTSSFAGTREASGSLTGNADCTAATICVLMLAYFRAATPACAQIASFDAASPETPIAPMI
jgi:hypothetical protein